MKVEISENPRECGYNAVTDTATIHREDADWMKELTGNIKREKDPAIIRQAEKDFHDAMTERYGGTIAGELLMRLWQSTREMRYENL